MARRRKKNRSISTTAPRKDAFRHAPHVEPVSQDFRHEPVRFDSIRPRPPRPRPPRPRPDFRPVEDLRHDTQEQNRTFRTVRGRPARIKTRPQGEVYKARLHTPVHSYFHDPHRVLVCIRREARKRVLFALRRIGRGKRVSREHRFTDKSYIRCK